MQDELIPREIRTIYEDYISDVIHLEATRKPTDGIFGFGKRADSDPCHDRFLSRLEQEFDTLAAASPSSDTVSAVMNFVFAAPDEHKDLKVAFWMLQAVVGLSEKLIVFLTPKAAAELFVSFAEQYPKRVRLPVHKKTALLLKAQAGGEIKKDKGLTHFFRGEGR